MKNTTIAIIVLVFLVLYFGGHELGPMLGGLGHFLSGLSSSK